MSDSNRNTLFKYFSSKKQDSEAENNADMHNTPKKQKSIRKLVCSSEEMAISFESQEETSLENSTKQENSICSPLIRNQPLKSSMTENKDEFGANSSSVSYYPRNTECIDKETNGCIEKIIDHIESNSKHSEPQKVSKIIADYLDVSPEECDLDGHAAADNSCIKEKEERRYDFLLDIRDKNMKRQGEEGYNPSTLYIPKRFYDKFTPFEKQFWDIKSEYFDTVIFFKKGKFYELYEGDAEIAASLFDLRITDRVNMKMAGVPESSYESWAAKFIAQGYKIGRVDQSENAIGKKLREQNQKKEKIILRELKEVITPGTIYNSDHLSSCFPFYLAVLKQHDNCYAKECTGPCHFSLILYDASINNIFVKSYCDGYDFQNLRTIFVQNDIKEIITSENLNIKKDVKIVLPDACSIVSKRKYDFQNEDEYLCYVYLYNYMKLLCRENSLESAVVSDIRDEADFISLDGSTLVNLDILTNNFDFTEEKSLFKSINFCSTPFGQRLLRKWTVTPLRSIEKILERRQVSKIFASSDTSELKVCLRELGDLERYMGKVESSNPSFKDLHTFIHKMSKCSQFLTKLSEFFSDKADVYAEYSKKYLKYIYDALTDFNKAYVLTDTDICPGNDNDELFVLERSLQTIQSDLDRFLEKLKNETGLKDLSYKSIGKEIFQVEAQNTASMPSRFYLVSSTKTTKRYYSKELKEIIKNYEETEELIFQSKGSILRRAVNYLKTFNLRFSQTLNYVAFIDCLISFSIFNKSYKTSEPVFGEHLEMVNFSNPIYPNYIKNSFCPRNKISLVTGPNMGGKSTFLRSICLNIILAQMGMNVVCDSMILPIFDRIFTRIGASDSLAKGESTFMVEMTEASKILNQSSKMSFVIMDELGRGTSTKDGEAIARAVLDKLGEIGCYTLFSTHYHRLVKDYVGTDKLFVKCKLDNNDITFLYKVEEGVCSDSHGLYVARFAGVPNIIVDSAFRIKKAISDHDQL